MGGNQLSAEEGPPAIDTESLKGLRQLVMRDELTDLYNRRYLNKLLKKERRQADQSKKALSLMFMDVDKFKEINDTHGHLCGDKVLVELGRILTASVRAIDVVFRYAGDEFVVVLPNAGEGEATSIAERIRSSVAEHSWADKDIPIDKVTLSIGLAFYPTDAADLTGLVEKADKALYLAKRRGRNLLCSTKELTAEEEKLRVIRPASVPKFVGREAEWGRMSAVLERCAGGEGGLVFVQGEAGVGKTRFVSELEVKGLLKDFSFLSGSCYEETASMPYFPFREAFARFFEQKKERLKYYRSLKGAYRNELRKLIPQVEEVPSAGEPSDKYGFFEAVKSLLLRVCKDLPLFLLLDDLHWADAASLDLLHYLARGVRAERILICGTLREEELAAVKGEKPELAARLDSMSRDSLFESIQLGRLSQSEASSMIDSLFPEIEIPGGFKELVYTRTEGNPFFVEEMLRSLEDELSQKGFKADRAPEVFTKAAIPRSVKGVIERRMMRLAEKDREILIAAALLGREFNFDILLVLSGVNEGHLLDVMDSAREVQLIEEDPLSAGSRFVFHHSLITEVLYGKMSRLRRQVLHRKAGEAMERILGEKKNEASEELARHFWEGGSYEKAALYARLAGDRAKELYANEQAVRLYSRALEALDKIERRQARAEMRFDILKGRQMVYDILGRRGSQREDLEEMVGIAEKLSDRKRLSDAYMSQSGFHNLAGEYPLARQFAEKALAMKKEIGDRAGEGDALAKLGMTYGDMGDNEQALKSHREALETYQDIGDMKGEGTTLFYMGIVWYNLGDYRKALDSYEQSMRIFRELGDRRREGFALCNIGVVHSRLGAYEEALGCYKAHLEISRKLGDVRGEAADLHNIGMVAKDSGSYEEALGYCQQALEINIEIGERKEEANCLGDIGDVYHRLGDYGQALKCHQEALEIQREIGDKAAEGCELSNLGGVHGSRGDRSKAIEFQNKALALAEEIGSKYLIVETKNSLSKICREIKGEEQVELAVRYSAEAAELSREIGLSHGEIQGLSNRSMAYLSLGEAAKALTYSAKAVSLLEERGQIEGPEEEVYFNHFKVLKAHADQERAREYLERAYDEVMQKAKRIKDKKLRSNFLKKVDLNGEIVQEWKRAGNAP